MSQRSRKPREGPATEPNRTVIHGAWMRVYMRQCARVVRGEFGHQCRAFAPDFCEPFMADAGGTRDQNVSYRLVEGVFWAFWETERGVRRLKFTSFSQETPVPGPFPRRPRMSQFDDFSQAEKSWAIRRLGNRSPANCQAVRAFPSKASSPDFGKSVPHTAQDVSREIAQKSPDPAID